MIDNLLFEIQNGNWAIAALSLMVICAMYLGHEGLALRVYGHDWRSRLTRGMRISLALMTLSAGVAFRSIEVTRWRMMGASDLSQMRLMIGGTIALIGFLCCIREISKPLYGNGPWLWTLVAMLAYTVAAIAIKFIGAV